MDKAMNMGKTSATGSFQLLIGVVGSNIIMALGTLVLAALLSRDQLGLYSVAIVPSSMISFFRDWGVNSALTKEIAQRRATEQEDEIHGLIVSGVIFEVISGALCSLICFALAGLLAAFLKMPDATALISISSIYIFAGAISAAAGGIFVGFERMKLNSLTTILSALVKTAIGPLLVVLGYGTMGAAVAYVMYGVVGGGVGIALVYFALYRPLHKLNLGRRDVFETLKPMLSFGIPLTLSNIMIGVLPLLFIFIMASIAGASLMGDFAAGVYFNVLLTFFVIPISTALFPTFAKVNPQKEPELLKTVFASATKYASVLIVPATILIMALSNPMVNTLWPNKFPNAPLFLTLYATVNLFVAIGTISVGALMTGLGQTRRLLLQSSLSLAFCAPIVAFLFFNGSALSPLTGMITGIFGIVLSGSSLPGLIWGLTWVWKKYQVKVDLLGAVKIFAASGAAALVTLLFLMFFNPSPMTRTIAIIQLVVGFFLFLLIYVVAAPLAGAVNIIDISNMRAMSSSLGIVSKVLELPLKIMEKILKLRGKARPNTQTKA